MDNATMGAYNQVWAYLKLLEDRICVLEGREPRWGVEPPPDPHRSLRICENPECRKPLDLSKRTDALYCQPKCQRRHSYLKRTGRVG